MCCAAAAIDVFCPASTKCYMVCHRLYTVASGKPHEKYYNCAGVFKHRLDSDDLALSCHISVCASERCMFPFFVLAV